MGTQESDVDLSVYLWELPRSSCHPVFKIGVHHVPRNQPIIHIDKTKDIQAHNVDECARVGRPTVSPTALTYYSK